MCISIKSGTSAMRYSLWLLGITMPVLRSIERSISPYYSANRPASVPTTPSSPPSTSSSSRPNRHWLAMPFAEMISFKCLMKGRSSGGQCAEKSSNTSCGTCIFHWWLRSEKLSKIGERNSWKTKIPWYSGVLVSIANKINKVVSRRVLTN